MSLAKLLLYEALLLLLLWHFVILAIGGNRGVPCVDRSVFSCLYVELEVLFLPSFSLFSLFTVRSLLRADLFRLLLMYFFLRLLLRRATGLDLVFRDIFILLCCLVRFLDPDAVEFSLAPDEFEFQLIGMVGLSPIIKFKFSGIFISLPRLLFLSSEV